MKSKDGPSEWSDCARYLKEIAELKKAFIEADYESVRQRMQYEDELSKLDEECSYAYRLLDDAKAEIERLKAEHSSGSQSEKMMLEEVGQPESNTNLRAPYSPISLVEENGH